MGLFDFLKHLGKEVPKDADMTAALTKSVTDMGLKIENFNVTFADGLATLAGVAETQREREIARLAIGNHTGVAKVNDDLLTVANVVSEAQAPVESKMYTVKSGDTLSKIAKETLGDANKYHTLFQANTPMLKNPDSIYPGQVLRIPHTPEHA
jgi:nucleoid-associated protein YgaU